MPVLGPFNFAGGYSPGYRFTDIPQGRGFATDMKNCRFSEGALRPRWGQVVANTSTLGAANVNGQQVWLDAVNSKTALVATCNAKIQIADVTTYTPTATVAFTDRTGAVTISSSANVRYTFDSLNGILIGCGNSAGGGVPFKVTAYNANAANLGGTPPNGDCVKTVNNYLFIGRQMASATTYSTLSWSNVVDPETWTAGNSVEVGKKDGEPIQALCGIGTDLYIFKQSSIWRLGTYSQSISGAVTLGPLQQVIRGTGCAGPLAIDNLPNGNIIFLGYDGRLYIFDGSSLLDISKLPYPGMNAYDIGNGTPGYGISVGAANTLSLVKTWKGMGEVWVGFASNIAGQNNLYNIFAYDYVNNIWQGYISDSYPKSFALLPITQAALTESNSDILFHGNATGSILAHGTYAKPYPTDEAGAALDWRVGTTIRLTTQDSDTFVPRSVCFETNDTGAGLAGLSLYYAFDTFFNGGSAAVTIVGASPTRTVVNIKMLQDSPGSNVLPTLMTFEFLGQGTGTSGISAGRLGQFFISDEVIR